MDIGRAEAALGEKAEQVPQTSRDSVVHPKDFDRALHMQRERQLRGEG